MQLTLLNINPLTTAHHPAVTRCFLFRALDETSGKPRIADSTNDKASTSNNKWLLCRNCLQKITMMDQRLVINNSHIHIFTNPQDFMFKIGCFTSAPGCTYRGIPTIRHTWFEDYSWRYAECSKCRHHLGWHFQKSDSQHFTGLILALLIESG